MTYLDSHVIKIHFLFKDHIIIIAKTIVYRSFKKKKKENASTAGP